MKSRNVQNEYDVKLGRIEGACSRYSLGRTTMRKLAEKAGAVVKVGSCYLINFDIMDSYFDQLRKDSTSAPVK